MCAPGAARRESHEKEGKWHDSEVSCRQDAVSKKDVLVIGRTDGAVHSHEFSCSYRGRELERRDTFKLGQTKIENVANFSFLASGYGYKYAGERRGICEILRKREFQPS